MEVFPFPRNHFSTTELKSSLNNHQENTQQSYSFIPLKIRRELPEEVSIQAISKSLINKCAHQIQFKSSQFIINGKENREDKDRNRNRDIAIEKIRRAITKFSFTQSSFYFAIQLMDIIIEKLAIKVNIDNIAIGSLILAVKFNENYNDICSIKSIQSSFKLKFHYSNDLLRELEMLCLKCINYDLFIVSPYTALEHIISRGIVFPSDFPNEPIKELKIHLTTESRKLLEKIIRKAHMYIKYNPFLLAMSIICFIRDRNYMPMWNEVFTSFYSITLRNILECYLFIESIILNTNSNTYRNSTSDSSSNCNNTYSQNILITSDYQPSIDTIDDNTNCKYQKIKVNTSSNLNELKLLSPSHYQKTIDSNYWKSQRSTSASLDEAPMTTKYPIRSNCSHRNFHINLATRSKSSIKNQPNVLYKPIKKYPSLNIDNNKPSSSLEKFKPIKTQLITVSQSIQNQMNKNKSTHKQNQYKIIKAFKKNSVLILDSNLKKCINDSQTHRVYAKVNIGNSSKDSLNNPFLLTTVQPSKSITKRTTNYKNNVTKGMNSKDFIYHIMNSKSKILTNALQLKGGFSIFNKSNKLKPYITSTNIGIKLPQK